MSHSQILMLRTKLQELLDADPMVAMRKRSNAYQQARRSNVVDPEFLEKLYFSGVELERRVGDMNDELKAYINDMDHLIADVTLEYIREDNVAWAQPNVMYRTADYDRQYRKMPLSDETKEIVSARINKYTDWRFPGLEIGPGDGYWTRELVACDPLYIVDFNNEFLESTSNTFNKKYQARLRPYLNNGQDLCMLPSDQFGFVFSWNVFNYLSFDQITTYLHEIFRVMRPGGACMFSYNNTERPLCALRWEQDLMTFIPKMLLRKKLKTMGFLGIETGDLDSTVSWIEFRKPGKLDTPKAAQTLGKIILTRHAVA